MSHEFDFERLIVWQKSIDLACSVFKLSREIKEEHGFFRYIEQLSSAALSISSNIAEGKGRESKKAYRLHLGYARGSLYEVLSILTVGFRQDWIEPSQYSSLRDQSLEIIKMLNALRTSLLPNP